MSRGVVVMGYEVYGNYDPAVRWWSGTRPGAMVLCSAMKYGRSSSWCTGSYYGSMALWRMEEIQSLHNDITCSNVCSMRDGLLI